MNQTRQAYHLSEQTHTMVDYLRETLPDCCLLSGIRLLSGEKHAVTYIDLIIITPTAVMVSVDAAHGEVDPTAIENALDNFQKAAFKTIQTPTQFCWLYNAPPHTNRMVISSGAELERLLRLPQVHAQAIDVARLRAAIIRTVEQDSMTTSDRRPTQAANANTVVEQPRVVPSQIETSHVIEGKRLWRMDARALHDSLVKAFMSPQYARQNLKRLLLPNVWQIEVHPTVFDKLDTTSHARQLEQGLLDALTRKNIRLNEDRFKPFGDVSVTITSSSDLTPKSWRFNFRFAADAVHKKQHPTAILRLLNSNQHVQWGVCKPVTVIGRSPTCDIVLRPISTQQWLHVSRKHARIRYDEGQFYLLDGATTATPSRYGTFVQGQHVDTVQPVKLLDGMEIILGASGSEATTLDIARLSFHIG
ncbi:MAG: FHA domain-containing protein [Candidatus Promineifilaceae bacterium]